MAMQQYRVSGIDPEGKTHWLQDSGYWGEVATAGLFTQHQAETHVDNNHQRNIYLNKEDRIVAKIERAM